MKTKCFQTTQVWKEIEKQDIIYISIVCVSNWLWLNFNGIMQYN